MHCREKLRYKIKLRISINKKIITNKATINLPPIKVKKKAKVKEFGTQCFLWVRKVPNKI
jgi:hypothetical protein